ncbi:MAG: FAD-dependent monooxygenase [Nitrospirota bacterium]|nr:MAG: FAD-dependent monooxygenase [Nitrospirota bacterium]
MADTPLLVVGGRTTGLMMSSELARRGVPVRIIDKSPGIDPHVRANLLHSRTLEIFLGLGIDEQATEGSFAEEGVRIYANKQLKGTLRHEPIDSPYPFGMSQSQAHTEFVLERHLNAQGVHVERNVELTAIRQGQDRVSATVRHADGKEEILETPWLIGCDGAHSTTRHLTGCAFPGDRDPYPYVLADVIVQGELEDHESYLFLHDEGDLFIFSTLPERRRLVCANMPPDRKTAEPPTLEFMQSLVNRRGLPGLKLSDPRWLINFRINYRLAPHYRHGRIFLAGDAAHIHSLVAGQGMNTGIQDAFNLAWKLALVTGGTVPESWLDTYESERRKVGEEVVSMTKTATEEMELFVKLSATERERLIAHMFVPESERLKAARHLQEVDLDYRTSPLSLEGEGVFNGGPHPGAQAPNVTPIVVNGTKTSLYRFLGGLNFRLLLFSGRKGDCPSKELDAACRGAARHNNWIDVCVVTTERKPELESLAWVTRIEDPSGSFHDRFGVEEPSLYLLRPDGYVAFRSQRLDSLDSFLDQVL